MAWYEILIGVLLVVLAVLITVIVLLQQSREAGLSGVISGGADTFFGKNKGRTMDAKLAKITKVLAGVMFAGTLVATLLFAFLSAK